MIARLTTDSDHNYIKENQFQENLFLLLKFLNLYYKCLRAYVHESFYYLLVILGDSYGALRYRFPQEFGKGDRLGFPQELGRFL